MACAKVVNTAVDRYHSREPRRIVVRGSFGQNRKQVTDMSFSCNHIGGSRNVGF